MTLMRQSDFAFANEVRAAVELRTPRTSRMLLTSSIAMLAAGLVWANFAVLDEVKRGNGKVVPSRQTQVVQSLEGGIVDAILIQEGSIVQQGAPLIRINDTNFSSQLGEIRERRGAMAARVERLQAESMDLDKLVFPTDLMNEAPRAVATETSVFETHSRKLAQDVNVLVQQEMRIQETLQLLNREVMLTRKLYERKVVPEIEMIRLERQASELRGQLAEVQSREKTVKTTFLSQVDDDLAKSKGDLAVLDETLKSAQDKVRRTELRAPVYGVVNKVNVSTVGAVVQPAASVVEIVPLDVTLLVEGRIRPQDIAFIRPAQDAVVKISAYDSNVYGSLKGKVERISADAIVEEKAPGPERNETFYRVTVRTEENHLGTAERPLPIIPGMVATIEVLTGEKTVLDYLIKPARMLRDEALREK
jgi:membrane fusion protein, adhesin transport system